MAGRATVSAVSERAGGEVVAPERGAERHIAAGPSHGQVLRVAVPIVIANATTALLGIVDTAIVGQLGPAHLIGGVAFGALILEFLFWGFGFLRMGTTGLTAQADGAGDAGEVRSVLARAVVIGVCFGAMLSLLQLPIRWTALAILPGSQAVEAAAATYFDIRIWFAPVTLANFAVLGWLIGLGRSDLALLRQLVMNAANIAISVYLVVGLGWGIAGVAIGTVLAEVLALLVGLGFAGRIIGRDGADWSLARLFDRRAVVKLAGVSSDIMVRTVLVVFAFNFFTAQSARGGDVTLAANAVLMHFASIANALLDGFAFAAERFVGHEIGGGRRDGLARAIRRTAFWSVAMGAAMSALFLAFGGLVVDLLTVSPDVRVQARAFLFWAAMVPLIGAAAIHLDGVFIGATRTRDMRNMMAVSVAIFLAAWAILVPLLGNHGLWASLWVFFLARAISLWSRLGSLEIGIGARLGSGGPNEG